MAPPPGAAPCRRSALRSLRLLPREHRRELPSRIGLAEVEKISDPRHYIASLLRPRLDRAQGVQEVLVHALARARLIEERLIDAPCRLRAGDLGTFAPIVCGLPGLARR